MAYIAAIAIGKCEATDSFKRYFQDTPAELKTVRSKMRYVASLDRKALLKVRYRYLAGPQGKGPLDMKVLLKVRYRYFTHKTNSRCDADPNLAGSLWNFPEDVPMGVPGKFRRQYRAEMMLCERLFTLGIQGPRPMRALLEDDKKCSAIKDSATPLWHTPGMTIFHELVHWEQDQVSYPANKVVEDWNDPPAAGVDPANGYGK